jgi:hypothetical protein
MVHAAREARRFGTLKSSRLQPEDVRAEFCGSFEGAHDALVDASAVLRPLAPARALLKPQAAETGSQVLALPAALAARLSVYHAEHPKVKRILLPRTCKSIFGQSDVPVDL